MTAAVADVLVRKGVARRDAAFVALAATTPVTTGIDDWAREPERGLAASIQCALKDLRTALGAGDRGMSTPESSAPSALRA